MRKLTLSILAAGAMLVPAAAMAAEAEQGHRGGGGGHFRGGGGFRGGGFVGGGFWGGGFSHNSPSVVIVGGHQVSHPGPHFRHRRLRRGGVVHPWWYGPQFHVGNWGHYGFADPGPHHRWIRYYDDAYLIDRRGRVVQSREDFDWDRYGDEWEVSDGIPAYRGRRDYHPSEEDYAWFEGHGEGGWDYSDYGHGGGEGYAEGHAGHGGTIVHGGPPPGYGYGYGYGYAYPIIVETTVVTGSAGYSEEVIEEVVEVQRPRRRVRPCNCPRPRAPAPRPRPRPPAGERG